MKHLLLTLMMATAVSTTAFAQNKVKNVYASSEKLNVEMLQNSDQTVQLNRYFFAGYNTLCLPMTVGAEQLFRLVSPISFTHPRASICASRTATRC